MRTMTTNSNLDQAFKSTPEHDGVDLRRAPRFSVEMRVRVLPATDKNSNWFGQASDISEYGMALMVPAEFAIGTKLNIEFTLPTTRHKLLVSAEIKNRKNFRYGVEFQFPTKHQREAIVKACRMLL
jgi:PilZ domain